MNTTAWFNGSAAPYRKGVYERRIKQGAIWLMFFALWDGEQWYVGQATAEMAACEPYISMNQGPDSQWRGLAQKPA